MLIETMTAIILFCQPYKSPACTQVLSIKTELDLLDYKGNVLYENLSTSELNGLALQKAILDVHSVPVKKEK